MMGLRIITILDSVHFQIAALFSGQLRLIRGIVFSQSSFEVVAWTSIPDI